MLTVSIQGSFEEAKHSILEGQKKGEMIELRIDLMEKQDLTHISKLRHLCKLPVIFTVRRKDQGGAFEGNEREREEKFQELLPLKPDFIDLEYDCAFADALDPSIPRIVSYHDFEKTPEDLEKILPQLNHFPAKIKKIATFANSSLDALRMLNFVQKHHVAGMCMGEKGGITRLLGPVVDSPLVYTFLGEATAPGQLSLEELTGLYRYLTLNRKTKVYALIGDPVDKSIGHLFHNEAFLKLNVDALYVKFPITPPEVPQFFKEIATLPFYGFSVTMPLKEHMAPHLDEVSDEGKEIGAINTLVKRGGKWFGTNTDGIGALDAIEKEGKVAGKLILIIGAGGAAKAIAYEASKRGGKVIIANRTMKKGEILAKQVKGMAVSIDEIPEYDILINTTSVGMAPEIDKLPIAEKDIQEKKVFFDVVINPKETKFLNLARNKGGKVIIGREMFEGQALQQLREWLS
ncbi:MAG: shikimate dehydrogenase [Chlamydiia bacterium]|nr:shikimate dehydrogenase [Chlamydiia bacterium]